MSEENITDPAGRIVRITDLADPGAAVYASLTETQLRNRLHIEQGMFVAESPKVIRVALDAGYEPVSLLCEERHITGDAADIIARCPEMTVITATGVKRQIRRRPPSKFRRPAGWIWRWRMPICYGSKRFGCRDF